MIIGNNISCRKFHFFIVTVFLHAEQNLSLQEGHCTAQRRAPLASVAIAVVVVAMAAEVEASISGPGPTKHTVSQPARGHQVRDSSRSISKQEEKFVFKNANT